LFRFAEGLLPQPSAKPTLGVWGLAPKKTINVLNNWSNSILLFQKRSKSVCSASQKTFPTQIWAEAGSKALFRFAEGLLPQPSAKPTLGVWGLAPKKTINVLNNWSHDILLFRLKDIA
jgi:hypothetical protein